MKGHNIEECYKLQNKEKQRGSNSSHNQSDSNMAELYPSFVLPVSNSGVVSDGWVIDTGSTFHLTPHRYWFSSYELVSGGMVIMGNSDRCDITSVRSIRLKTHDGLIKVLSDVKHIRKAGKKLISVGCLISKGYNSMVRLIGFAS